MKYMKITLCVFSGMPDPEYMIHSKDPDYKRIEGILPMAGSFQLPSGKYR